MGISVTNWIGKIFSILGTIYLNPIFLMVYSFPLYIYILLSLIMALLIYVYPIDTTQKELDLT